MGIGLERMESAELSVTILSWPRMNLPVQIWFPFNQNHCCNIWPGLVHYNTLPSYDLVQHQLILNIFHTNKLIMFICHVQITHRPTPINESSLLKI